MTFNDQIKALSQRVPNLKDHLKTEEATKNALVMPFIKALGYDVFNPQEVIPEFTADVGTKKGEKVDYAIMQDREITMLIECKKAKTDLSLADISQLYRYFTVTKARIAVLTNGVQYRFYTDLDAPNRMDSRPFLELDDQDIAIPFHGDVIEESRLEQRLRCLPGNLVIELVTHFHRQVVEHRAGRQALQADDADVLDGEFLNGKGRMEINKE